MITTKPVINENLCIGCGACSQVCSQGAIVMQPREVIAMQIPSERIGTLENKIRMLGEGLGEIKNTIEEIKRR
jgi:ferredoxin